MASGVGMTPDSGDEFDPQAEREKLRAKLKDDIFSIWRNNKADKYNLGKHLATLQELHAKPGWGTFLEDLNELDIPHVTAYRRIKFYNQIEAIWEAGIDPDLYPVRSPYRNGKDDARFPVDTQYDQEDLEAAADKKQAEIDAIIKAEAEKIAKLKAEQKGKVPRLHISLVLPKGRRDRFKKKWNKMDEATRSELVYKAVMNANTN